MKFAYTTPQNPNPIGLVNPQPAYNNNLFQPVSNPNTASPKKPQPQNLDFDLI